MARATDKKKTQAAWARIEELGGHGVWESDMVVVSFDGTQVTDDDLLLFQDFPFVQILDLSNTKVTDKGLAHLRVLTALENLIVIKTKIGPKSLEEFQKQNPNVEITTKPKPKSSNPFAGL